MSITIVPSPRNQILFMELTDKVSKIGTVPNFAQSIIVTTELSICFILYFTPFETWSQFQY